MSDRMDKAEALYNTLIGVVLEEICRIDGATPWPEVEPQVEPQWWLDMMEIDRLIRSKKKT